MKKLLLIILLTFVSTSAKAEWTFIDGNEDTTLYADVKSKRKLKNKVKMWILMDFNVQQGDGNGYLSAVILDEYDCVNETRITLASNFYSGNMQNGSVIGAGKYAVGETTNIPISPNTLDKAAWLKACSKK